MSRPTLKDAVAEMTEFQQALEAKITAALNVIAKGAAADLSAKIQEICKRHGVVFFYSDLDWRDYRMGDFQEEDHRAEITDQDTEVFVHNFILQEGMDTNPLDEWDGDHLDDLSGGLHEPCGGGD